MTPYHACQLVQTVKETNMTKVELLNLVEHTFDGKVHIQCYYGNYFYLSSVEQDVSMSIDGEITYVFKMHLYNVY